MGINKKIGIGIVVLAVLIGGGYGIAKMPSIEVPSTADISTPEALAGFTMPEGFMLSLYAEGVPGARVIAMDNWGDLIVSSTKEGKIFAVSDKDKDGEAERVETITSGLNKPHGLAFQCDGSEGNCKLYVAEETQVSVYDYTNPQSNSSIDSPKRLSNKKKLVDLPKGDRHYTRTLLFGADGRLYVSIGSTCDVCEEKDERIASIYSMRTDGTDFKKVASGLRNSVFMTLNPIDGKIWATEMGRDNLGDNIPPDEINIIEPGKNYGWPICYGKKIHDTQFDTKVYIRDPCADTVASFIDLQAHSAPLGLAFVPEEGWPEEYWHDVLVAYHGSWNRSAPTGYKIARIKLNEKSEYIGIEDFISGWLTKEGEKTGRPVDIKLVPGGVGYISDDQRGVIYKLSRTQ